MISAVDQYLKTLLAFVPRNAANRFTKDYIALIHVPAVGPEKVYSLVLDEAQPMLTVASYKSAVWEIVEDYANEDAAKPELDALQAQVAQDHPAFYYLDSETLKLCDNYSDGRAGLDYYLMLWQRDGETGVSECYEPYSRDDYAWASVIGAMQVLASQFEYAIQ
ncbi:hypothetical protein [Pelagicoccus sp. SDUM812002]|uniref:hypothetical protein n=1 Tax=Pelagicoccus sp. SDUM812002 TaxID=3041266 RepID=UPI0028102AED|nr:hypothetical protein [Pelagicoccus sp. SDUM812002]MDQ8185975.1 hypothetical protein [Pelagicoccus sp. SDUM812002]